MSSRIDWLLRHTWRNNIAAMARDLGVSHTALSRVLAGQMPSAKMLEALGNRADVNALWLLTGQGQQPPERAGAVGGVFWPVVARLLPGEPRQHPELLTPITLPAASPFTLEGAYWLQVTADAPIAADRASRVTAGDYLLIETATRWTRRHEAYLGRILALRVPGNGNIFLAKSRREPLEFEGEGRDRQHELNTFKVLTDARLFPLLDRPENPRKYPKTVTGGSGLTMLFADDVVGVVVQVVNFLEDRE